jgi:acyl-CoA reductase-like NAD-dependent aldehyde dehydrogenase
MKIIQEEIFRPVQILISFEDDEGVICIANGRVYGLSEMAFSGDKIARPARIGTMSVNGGMPICDEGDN